MPTKLVMQGSRGALDGWNSDLELLCLEVLVESLRSAEASFPQSISLSARHSVLQADSHVHPLLSCQIPEHPHPLLAAGLRVSVHFRRIELCGANSPGSLLTGLR